jgi:hypothetical protein
MLLLTCATCALQASFVEGAFDMSGRSMSSIGIDVARQSNFIKNDKFNIRWHTLFWIFALGIFPIFYNTCLMATITGVYDEGLLTYADVC